MGWVVIPCAWLAHRFLPAERRGPAMEAILFRGYRVYVDVARAVGRIRYRAPELPADLPDAPFAVVANHPSMLDVMLVLSAFQGVRCVVKRSWFSSLLLGPILRAGRHIPGPDLQASAAGDSVLDRIVARLGRGESVLLFPEGTRSPRFGLRRFKRGAVEAALRAGVPIVPVYLSVLPPALLKGQPLSAFPDRGIDLALEFLPILDPSQGGEDSRALTRTLKERYEERVEATRARFTAEGALGDDGVGQEAEPA